VKFLSCIRESQLASKEKGYHEMSDWRSSLPANTGFFKYRPSLTDSRNFLYHAFVLGSTPKFRRYLPTTSRHFEFWCSGNVPSGQLMPTFFGTNGRRNTFYGVSKAGTSLASGGHHHDALRATPMFLRARGAPWLTRNPSQHCQQPAHSL
jgi:hypothetical protein